MMLWKLLKPWYQILYRIGKLTAPIPPGLWLINTFYQRVLLINGDIPWMVHFTSKVAGNITIGCKVWLSFAISGGCYFNGINGIDIDDGTLFAPGVKIISANHNKDDFDSWDEAPPIRIGKRCWIGANAVILPGVNLGDDCIVGAGAVVTKDFPDRSIIVGVPGQSLS